MKETKCHKIEIPEDVCYMFFARDKKPYKTSGVIGSTNRGEELIVDFDEDMNIIGIELLGSDEARKPCQGGLANDEPDNKQ